MMLPLARYIGVAALILAPLFGAAPITAEPVTVPLIIERGVLFVRGNLNGNGPLLFVFDPGAGDFVTVYARDRLQGKPVRELDVGGASIHTSLPVAPGDPQQFDTSHDPALGTIAGSVGPSLLNHYAVRIDYKQSTVAFIPFKDFTPPPHSVAFQMFVDSFGVPALQASVDGFSGAFEIDVRAPSSMLFTPFLERNGFAQRYSSQPVLKESDIGRQYALANVSIGPFAVHNTPTWFSNASQGKFASGQVGGLLGNAVLSNFAVTFDYAKRTIYLERSSTSTRR